MKNLCSRVSVISGSYLDHWEVWLNELLDLGKVDLLSVTLSEETRQDVGQQWSQNGDDIIQVDSLDITLAEPQNLHCDCF